MLNIFRSRKLVSLLIVGSIACSIAACSSEEEKAPASDPAAAPQSIVGASEEAQKELGVNEWHVTQGDSDKSFYIVGFDTNGAMKAEMSIFVEPTGDNSTGVITYDVTAPEAFKLRYEVFADKTAKSNVEESAATPLAQKVIALAGKDLENAEAKKTESQSLVGKQSLNIQMGRGGGGTQLVRPGGQRVVNPGQCLRDSSGNGCMGQLLQTVGGVVGTGICLFASGFTLGLATAACAAGGVATIGSAVSMYESGCKLRPCTSGAPTS